MTTTYPINLQETADRSPHGLAASVQRLADGWFGGWRPTCEELKVYVGEMPTPPTRSVSGITAGLAVNQVELTGSHP